MSESATNSIAKGSGKKGGGPLDGYQVRPPDGGNGLAGWTEKVGPDETHKISTARCCPSAVAWLTH